MKKKLWHKLLIWLSRIRYRRGYGVQSPFAYSIFRDILFEKLPYYAFDRLKDIKDPYLTRHTLQVMFRLVNMISPKLILDIYPTSPATTCYISCVCSKSRTLTITNNQSIISQLRNHIQKNEGRTEIRSGNALKETMDICNSAGKINFVHIGNTENHNELLEICKVLTDNMAENGIIILDNINRQPANHIWKMLNESRHSSMAFDLYDIGIIFFNSKLNKEYYKVNY